ncbi:MAG: glycosyltransferase [Malacoplasma sp.]
MKAIILITNEFPYGKGETFIANEITFSPKEVKSYIFHTSLVRQSGARTIPEHWDVIKLKMNKVDNGIKKLNILFKTIFSSYLWKELLYLLKQHKIHYLTIKRAIAYLVAANDISFKLIKTIKSLNRNTECSEFVLYTYWLSPMAIAALFTKKRLKKIRCICVSRCHGIDLYQERHEYDYIPYRKFIYKNEDLIIPISDDGLNYINNSLEKQNINGNVSRIGTIDHGFNECIDCNDDYIRIVSCSNIISVKRIDRIVDSLKNITDIKIIWIHFGTGNLYPDLKKLCMQLPPNIQYELKGQTDIEEIFLYYLEHKCHLFVNTSESEGLPVSIMEALSCGIPVAAPDVGGIKEALQDGENGFLLSEERIVKELTRAIYTVFRMSNEEYSRMRKNARTKWENMFDAQTNSKQFYEKIMNLKDKSINKYHLLVEHGSGYNATSKARSDTSKILNKEGWNPLKIDRIVGDKYIDKIIGNMQELISWIKLLNKLKKNSYFLIQYPEIMGKKLEKVIINLLLMEKKKKKLKIILMIHDIESLRTDNPEEIRKQKMIEKTFFSFADILIAHNEKMKQFLMEDALIKSKKIYTLDVFDYLSKTNEVVFQHHLLNKNKKRIAIAGNLTRDKCGYLYSLGKLKNDYEFNIYGVGLEEKFNESNIHYKGKFEPEELLEKLEGEYGLIWDGDSLETCKGSYGRYMKINNPHKLSLFLAAGIPVIVWKEAAIADYIIKKNIGITINTLYDLTDILNKIDQNEYDLIKLNAWNVGKELRNGQSLSKILAEF